MSRSPVCAVVGPLFFLTVTIELENDSPRVHLHPGGQGFWIARMVRVLGQDVRLVSPVGGESGDVLGALVPEWEIELDSVRMTMPSPVQVHDRRTGERDELVGIQLPELDRHEADDLYAAVLKSALAADAVVLTAASDGLLPYEACGRLVHDLGEQDVPLVADLHGGALDAVLERGRLDVLKVSDEDLREDGWDIDGEDDAVGAARELARRGARTIVVSRGAEPAVAHVGGRIVRVRPPALEEVDHAGAGDSMTAGIATGLMLGLDPIDAVKLGAAAGAGNVTRHGLGSGDRDLIVELAQRVEVEEIG